MKHGHSGKNPSPEYNTWAAMKKRCYYPKTNGYKNYGGKGITVCDRWKDSFENFLADMGCKPTPAHSLDRFPNKNGNYEPGNCRWATIAQQDGFSNTFYNAFIVQREIGSREAFKPALF